MPLIDVAGVGGERGAGEREAASQGSDQRVGDRTDIAPVGTVEGGAVFEEELSAADGTQPAQRRQAFLHGLLHRCGAGLERNHDGVGIGRRIVRARDTDGLDRTHAVADQHGGKVGGAGEIIGNGTEQHR